MGVIAKQSRLKMDPVLMPAPRSYGYINAKKHGLLKKAEPGDSVRIVIDAVVERVNISEDSHMVDLEITDVYSSDAKDSDD